jgi:hypothetical protein
MNEFASFEDSRRTRANVLFPLGKRHSFASFFEFRDPQLSATKFSLRRAPADTPLQPRVPQD